MDEADFKRKLTPAQFKILRQGETETPFSGMLLDEKGSGVYRCAACGNNLFSSNAKYDSGSGWPSFYEPARKGAVIFKKDKSLGAQRVEVQCAQCASHLGHVFGDGPRPTGQRYCINSVALDFNGSNDKRSDSDGRKLPRRP